MPSLHRLRDGFAWWLPLATAALAAAVAALAAQSTASAWDADVHLWAREGPGASEYAQLLLDPAVQDAAASSMMASEDGAPQLDRVSLELTDTLIRLTVRAPNQADAEALAISLAHAAASEARTRYGDDAGLDVLGLVRPGARKVAPTTEWIAAWSAALGLAVGLAFSWSIARRTSTPASTLGRLGRFGIRPLAVISAEAERAAGDAAMLPPEPSNGAAASTADERGAWDDAAMLASAINDLSGIVALVPLDDASGVTATLIRTARTLAARGRPTIWLDGRRPAFALAYGAPPSWLTGARWTPVRRSELMLRTAASVQPPNGCVFLLTDPLNDALDDRPALAAAESAVGVILLARADAPDEDLIRARELLGSARLLGAALTQAQTPELRDFELAQFTD